MEEQDSHSALMFLSRVATEIIPAVKNGRTGNLNNLSSINQHTFDKTCSDFKISFLIGKKLTL
jgi:hypothetical protein